MKNDVVEVINCQKRENHTSHAYLIETNDFEKFDEKLKRILKILLCENSESYCDECQNCHFIDRFEHPNVVFIYPEGANIKIQQITNLKERFNTKATYSKYNIYVIMGAEKLNSSSGNALLKFLEEPEDNIIGILIANNRSLVLPTIVSRCQLFTDFYAEEQYLDDVKELAKKIEECYSSDENIIDYSDIIKNVEDKTLIKKAFSYILNQEISNKTNIKKIIILKEIVDKMRYNVNIDLLLLNYLIRMREVNE